MKKKPIGVLVNDVHLNKDNGDLIKDIFCQIIDLCDKLKVDKIFCGGDIFTNRSGQPLSCLTDWKEVLENIASNDKHLYVIPGNHDKTDPDDNKSYLDVYSEKCINVYREAGVLEISEYLAICFIPYFSDEKWLSEYDNLKHKLKDCEANKLILITHSGFDGVMNNDGSRVESLIKPSMFKDFTNVLIGHYHNASKLAENVIYTGSAYQNNFGENIIDKGFTIIYDDGTISFVKSKFPKYIKEVLDINDSESLRNVIEKYDGETYDHIRLIFKGKKVDAKKVNLPELAKLGFDAKYESVEENEAIEVAESEEVLSYDKKTIMKDFIQFCSQQNIRGKELKFGMNLIKNI